MAWLGATSVHSTDPRVPGVLESLRLLCAAHPALHVIVNHFDAGDQSRRPTAGADASSNGDRRITFTWVPGMKGLFWKRVLTPERVRPFRVLWLFDADVSVHPSVLPLAPLVGTLLATDASLLQPAVRAAGGETQHTWLRARATHISCVATTAKFVELQTPLFAADAWQDFHSRVLAHLPDAALELSSFGLDVTWCGALAHAFPHRPTCLVVHHANAVHLNALTVSRFAGTRTRSSDRQCSETCHALRSAFPAFYGNTSHHTRECWRLNATDGTIVPGPSDARLVIDTKGRVRASVRVLYERPDAESAVPYHARPSWLGVTSLPSRERRRTDALVVALRALCDEYPQLRVVINHDASGGSNGAATQAAPGMLQQPALGSETDERIQTSYYATLPLLWRSLLSPKQLTERNVKFVWLFAPDVVVHPSALPLGQLIQIMLQTGALLVQPGSGRQTGDPLRHSSAGKGASRTCLARSILAASTASPIMRTDAWHDFYRHFLGPVRPRRLATLPASAVAHLGAIWCPLLAQLYPQRSASCVEAPWVPLSMLPPRGLDRQAADGCAQGAVACAAQRRASVAQWLDVARINRRAQTGCTSCSAMMKFANGSASEERGRAACWGLSAEGRFAWKRT